MHMHGHAACACLTAPRCADDAEAGRGVSGRANARSNVGHRATAAGADGHECRATWVGVGGERASSYHLGSAQQRAARRRNVSLYACGDSVSGYTQARGGVAVRPVQRGGP